MSLNCSVFCVKNSPKALVDSARGIEGVQCTVLGDDENWQSLEITTKEAKLVVTRLDSDTAVGEFDDLVDSTLLFAESTPSNNTDNQQQLENALNSCTLILGVTVDPDFDEIAEEVLFSMVALAQGVVFTGNLFLNKEGGLILDMEGNSEEGTLIAL